MSEDDAKLDAAQGLTNDLHHLAVDMEDKKNRLKKFQDDFTSIDYTAKLEEKARRSRELQDQKDALNGEFINLNMQASSRAKLDLKRAEIRTKTQDVKNMWVWAYLNSMRDIEVNFSRYRLRINNAKFRTLVGVDPKPETVERDVEQAIAYIPSLPLPRPALFDHGLLLKQ